MHDHESAAEHFRRLFCSVFCPCKHRDREVIRVATIGFDGFSVTAKGEIMLNLNQDQVPGSGTYKFKFLSAGGKPAKVDGLPTITATDPTVVNSIGPVTDNGDGTFSAPFHLLDTTGVSQTIVNADVDLGAGVNNKDFVDVISIIPAEAAAIQGDFGTVTPDP